MTYVSWAALYEGATDRAYFELLIPRVMEDIIMQLGTRHAIVPPSPAIILQRSTIEGVAKEACATKDAFHLLFIHADTGGRGLAGDLDARSFSYCEAIHSRCEFRAVRCITISPRHETEAWILADPQAVIAALGYVGSPASIGLPGSPVDAERLQDPKAVLMAAVRQVRGRRRPFDAKQLFPAIAQRQSLATLRKASSFVSFEANLQAGLRDIGCI
jgi:Domain of unknown function (DUF4276)